MRVNTTYDRLRTQSYETNKKVDNKRDSIYSPMFITNNTTNITNYNVQLSLDLESIIKYFLKGIDRFLKAIRR